MSTGIFDTEKELASLNTDKDHDELFTKLAKQHKCAKFAQLEEKVVEHFGDKLKTELNKWAVKLVLDRNKLKEIFIGG